MSYYIFYSFLENRIFQKPIIFQYSHRKHGNQVENENKTPYTHFDTLLSDKVPFISPFLKSATNSKLSPEHPLKI